jgi:hypothetical protein
LRAINIRVKKNTAINTVGPVKLLSVVHIQQLCCYYDINCDNIDIYTLEVEGDMNKGPFVQRMLPGIRSGAVSTASGGNIHVRQGQLDGACGIYCAAMCLTLLGRIKGPTELTGKRRSKTVTALWDASLPQYFEGTSAEELACIISSAGDDLDVTWKVGENAPLAKSIARGVVDGNVAVVGWQSRNRRFDHWILAVGIEVQKRGGVMRPTALLCLDPNEEAPTLCAYNSRIELSKQPGRDPGFQRYVTNRATMDVALNEVVWVAGSC